MLSCEYCLSKKPRPKSVTKKDACCWETTTPFCVHKAYYFHTDRIPTSDSLAKVIWNQLFERQRRPLLTLDLTLEQRVSKTNCKGELGKARVRLACLQPAWLRFARTFYLTFRGRAYPSRRREKVEVIECAPIRYPGLGERSV